MLHELAAFLADGIRHHNNSFVAAHSADERKPDALIAACRLNDDCFRPDAAFLFGLTDHVVGGAGFDGAAGVEALKFHENFGIAGFVHAVQSDHRGMADCVEN